MTRRLIIVCRAAAFVLLVATLAIWYRSRHGGDCVRWGNVDLERHFTTWTRILSRDGVIEIVRDRLQLNGPGEIRPERVKAALPRGTRMIWSPARDTRILTPRTPSFWDRLDFACVGVNGEERATVTARNNRTCMLFPLWAVAAFSAAILLSGVSHLLSRWRNRRRLVLGHCIHCDYDLRASSRRCPECGQLQFEPLAPPRRASLLVITSLTALVCAAGVWAGSTTAVFNDVAIENVTWLELGRNGVEQLNTKTSTGEPLTFRRERRWFVSRQIPATQLEQDVVEFRRYEGMARSAFAGYPTLDSLPYVRPPDEIPTEDQGVSLSLKLTPGLQADQMSLEIQIISPAHPVTLHTFGYRANELPFLFALSVDGRPVIAPTIQKMRQISAQLLTLVIASGTRKWEAKIDEMSLRQLLPDTSAHVVEIYAAFSDEEFDSNVPANSGSQVLMQMAERRSSSGPQLLVRSNPARLQWTDQTWKVVAP